jgi:hypothetical protein
MGKSKEFLQAESHAFEPSSEATHEVGQGTQAEENHAQAGPESVEGLDDFLGVAEDGDGIGL